MKNRSSKAKESPQKLKKDDGAYIKSQWKVALKILVAVFYFMFNHNEYKDNSRSGHWKLSALWNCTTALLKASSCSVIFKIIMYVYALSCLNIFLAFLGFGRQTSFGDSYIFNFYALP